MIEYRRISIIDYLNRLSWSWIDVSFIVKYIRPRIQLHYLNFACKGLPTIWIQWDNLL